VSRHVLRPIGVIRSTLKDRKNAPRQGDEGAPDAWLEVRAWAAKGLAKVRQGDALILITWLHRGKRDVFQVYPRGVARYGLFGVFATRSPDRPNPLGLHPVTVRRISGNRLRVGPIEAIDGTPVVDIKPVLPIRARWAAQKRAKAKKR
jgi:tRNA-Thr(GGU) m(6)t(6)A37 methyltransferase TsaA